jgi:hypothetical protein
MLRAVLVILLVMIPANWAGAQTLDELRKQKLDTARAGFAMQLQKWKNLQGVELEKLCSWSERWLEAALAIDPKADPVPHLQANVDRLREVEGLVETYVKSGQLPRSELLAATYFRVDAQVRLELAKKKK